MIFDPHNPQDNDEVVALCIKGDIYCGKTAIKLALDTNCVDGYIVRSVFKFMTLFDLGPIWDEFANAPTLFKKSELNVEC